MPTDLEEQEPTTSTREEQKEKSFPFLRLPFDLQCRTVEKLGFIDWSQLRRCNKASNSVCDAIRCLLPLDAYCIDVMKKRTRVTPGTVMEKYLYNLAWKRVTKFPCKCNVFQVTFMEPVTSEKLEKFYKSFLYKEVTAKQLVFSQQTTCEVDEIVKLAELLGIEFLRCSSYLKPEFFNYPIAQKLNAIYLKSCRMTDKQFLSLKAEWIEIRCDTITTKAINRFLKEWFEGKREMQMLDITAESSQIGRSEEELVEGLPINPVWSPDLHETSIISPIPSQELQELWSDDPRSYYCMWRSSEIYRCRKLQLNREQLLILNGNDADIIETLLTEDQFYYLFNICKYCNFDYCEHRIWLSTARLSRSFPRVYNGLISLVKLSRALLTGYILYTGSNIADGL